MTFKRNNLSQDVIHALTLTLVLCLTLLSGCSDKEEILPPEPEEGTDIVSEYKAYVGHPFNVRARNVGWRIDYFCVSNPLAPRVKGAAIHPDVTGSDHCPVSLEIDC